MHLHRRSASDIHPQASTGHPVTTADLWFIQSSPVYAYGINLQPAERMAEEVMKLNAQLAHDVRETGAIFTLDDLDQRFQALLATAGGLRHLSPGYTLTADNHQGAVAAGSVGHHSEAGERREAVSVCSQAD